MRKNRLLGFAMFICKCLCLLQIIIFFLLTSIVIYWHINPDYFGTLQLTSFPFRSTFGYTVTQSWVTASHHDPLAYKNIIPASLYFNYIHLSSILLLNFLALNEFNKVMRSVKLIQTFKMSNVHSFRKIGRYLFLIFILSSFFIMFFKQGQVYGFFISFTPLILTCIAYIVAEIFKEGNNLLEENQLTV